MESVSGPKAGSATILRESAYSQDYTQVLSSELDNALKDFARVHAPTESPLLAVVSKSRMVRFQPGARISGAADHQQNAAELWEKGQQEKAEHRKVAAGRPEHPATQP